MKRKVEFIESYIKVGNDYQWNDNHGELIRCKDCKAYRKEYYSDEYYCNYHFEGIDGEPLRSTPNDYCAWAERMDEDD